MLKLKQLMPGMFISLSFAMVSSVEAATVVNPDNGDPVMSITGLEICISSDEICEKKREELEQNEIQTIGIYDVVFEYGGFDEIFADPTDPDNPFIPSCDNGLCFWGNPGQANRAIESLKERDENGDPIMDENGESIPINGSIGINDAMNMLDEIPENVFGILELDNPFPPPESIELPFNRPFYLVPISFDGDMTVSSRKGDYGGISWRLQTGDNEENDVMGDPNDPDNTGFQPYAHFSRTGTRQVLPIPPDPPDTPDVPEPSGLMGILFTAGSLLMAIKKKN